MEDLTVLEQKIIDGYKKMKANGYDLIFLDDCQIETGGDMKQLRGALSSLVKKGLMYVDKESNGMLSYFGD